MFNVVFTIFDKQVTFLISKLHKLKGLQEKREKFLKDVQFFKCHLREEITPRTLQLKKSIRKDINEQDIWKIERLILKSIINKKESEYREWQENLVVNLTEKSIPDDYMRFLSYGVGMNLPYFDKSLDTIADIELAIFKSGLDKNKKEEMRIKIAEDLKKFKTKQGYMMDQKAKKYIGKYNRLKKFLHRFNLGIVKADKSRQLIIMNLTDLDKKKQEIIKEGNFEKLELDPTSNIQKLLKKIVGKLIKEGAISITESKELLPGENVRMPKLNVRIKTHKQNKCRPIVDFKMTVLYNLEIFLKKSLQVILNSELSIKNTDSLISRLEAGRILPEYRLMSIDIVSMYPSITKEMIIQSLIKGEYFRQKDGISMGSVVGPKLAEIVMKNIDKTLLNLGGIVFLARYVDDIFIIYNSKITSPEKILKEANEINEHIKFTYECEKLDSLNYLDITITRFKDHLEYSRYEKPCNTNKVINFRSYCPINQKRNIYLMEVKKIFSRTTRSEKRIEELKKINKKYLLNNYPKRLLRNWYDEYSKRRFQVKQQKESKKYVSFPYIQGIFEKYKKIFCKNLIQLAPLQKNRLSELIRTEPYRKKDLLEEDGVVYRLQCTCGVPYYYVGETKRKLKVRMSEHLAAVRNKINTSPVFLHCHVNNCQLDINNVKIIHKEKNIVKRKFKEHFAIIMQSNVMNLNNGVIPAECWEEFVLLKDCKRDSISEKDVFSSVSTTEKNVSFEIPSAVPIVHSSSQKPY
ncbi:uncharacterized protein LOC111626698 [Centruroides sculpturatus]|uniref:uncharacterized protein LOC111626698 n=1 Tax=Centruroides sculpturatus TaxID=218467 RepID=UPI000C6E120D|nr:uncharacterized protein LOC111626698 [Centruroides sculpturatus]